MLGSHKLTNAASWWTLYSSAEGDPNRVTYRLDKLSAPVPFHVEPTRARIVRSGIPKSELLAFAQPANYRT
jgi:hypothetical protein